MGEFLAAWKVDPNEALRGIQAEVAARVPADVRGADRAAFATDLSRILFEQTRTPGEGLWVASADRPLCRYLGGVAKNLVKNRNRRATREGQVLRGQGGSEIGASAGPGDLAERKETRERVREVLGTLGPKLGPVASGCLDDQRKRDLASSLGVSARTLRRRIEDLREAFGHLDPGAWNVGAGSADDPATAPSAPRPEVPRLADLARAASVEELWPLLRALKYGPAGFRCPACAGAEYWHLERRGVDECRRCHRQTSLTAGTPFHGLRRLGKALRAFH